MPTAPAHSEATTPVEVIGTAGRSPFVFASPHSGDALPADMGARAGLAADEMLSAGDALVDQLIAAGANMGAVLVLGRVSRAYLDCNRSPDEIDPALTPEASEGRGARVSGGYGLIHRLSGRGTALYDRQITMAEVQARVAAVHAPYHAALERAMQAAREAHGVAVLVDWHSMPSAAARGVRGPQVVLGDRHGSSCANALTREARRLFEKTGARVALNAPYAGGYCTRLWGRPEEGFHALQVELSRGLYLDEATRTAGPGFMAARTMIETVMAGLVALDPGLLGPAQKKTAAEAAVESL